MTRVVRESKQLLQGMLSCLPNHTLFEELAIFTNILEELIVGSNLDFSTEIKEQAYILSATMVREDINKDNM